MTVSSEVSSVSYAGDGVSTVFPIPYYFLLASDLEVLVIDSNGAIEAYTLDADYSVSGAGNQAGGQITLLGSPIPVGRTLVANREPPATQETDYQANDPFPAEEHEKALDKLTMLVQRLTRTFGNALRYPVSENLDGTLPRRSERLGMLLGFDPVLGRQMMVPLPASVGAGDMVVDTFVSGVDFTPDVTTQLTLSRPPGTPGNLEIFFDPLFQGPDQWTLIGSTLTFNSPIPSGVGKVFARIGTTLSTLVPPPGSVTAADVLYLAPYANTVLRTQSDYNSDFVSVFNWMTPAQRADVTSGNMTQDVTAALNAAYASGVKHLYHPPGGYKITGQLLPLSNTTLFMGSGVTIKQFTANINIFRVVQKDNVWIIANGALFIGEGTWSASWVGSSGHEDRGVQFLGCTNCGLVKPRIRNCGHSGLVIFGGRNILVDTPTIEGTNLYSTTIPFQGNFQFGVYIKHGSPYGTAEDIRIVSPDISGTAQGILVEWEAGAVPTRGVTISNPVIHDIPGQHAFYITSGNVTISAPLMTNIALSGVKIQAGDVNGLITGVTATGCRCHNLGGNMFEVVRSPGFGGSIEGIILSGTGDNINRGIAVTGPVKQLHAVVECINVDDTACTLSGDNILDSYIEVVGENVTNDGVLITSTASRVEIKPTLRNVNASSGAAFAGVHVATASGTYILVDPDITDAFTRQRYGVFNEVAGADVKIRGSIRATGCADTAIRAIGTISEFPQEAILQGVNGMFTQTGNIASTKRITNSVTTNSASNAVLWLVKVPVDQAMRITVEIVTRQSTSGARRSIILSGLFYRVGAGIVTLQGAITTIADADSGISGAISLASNGADSIVLQVNSGGAATYFWTARIDTSPAV
ncbi:MAG TPA: hypothetical protein VJ766_05840 [Pseudoxanthomonas sp.]|nr:hypothetical protein [Pseudoxanthomonas sp.]